MLRYWSIRKISIKDGDVLGLGNIQEVTARLLVVSEMLGCEVHFFFNHTRIIIKPGMTQKEAVAAYLRR